MTSKRLVGLVAMVLVSAQAMAMRVGDLVTQSRLNEPLRATLTLSDLTNLEAQNLDVRVADAETYERLGLVRSSSVEGLNFRIAAKQGQSWQLDLIGNRAIREPYVVLLLDIRSSTGRALREFTVLLDPGPVLSDEEVAAESTAVAEAQTEIPAPQSFASAPAPQAVTYQPAVPAQAGKPVAGNQPMVSSKDYQYARQRGTSASEYGPVRAGESLSSIANQLVNATGAHVSQVMWALYANNPQAFDGSINNLQRGATLRVPSYDELTAISVAQARTNIRDAAGVAASSPRPASRPAQPVETAASQPPPAQDRLSQEVFAGGTDYADEEAKDTTATRVSAGSGMDSGDEFDVGGSELPADAAGADGGMAAEADDAFEVEEAPSRAPKVVITDTASSGGVLGMLGDWLLPILGGVLAIILLLFLVLRSRRNKVEEQAFVSAQEPARPRPDLISMARGEPVPDPTEVMPAVDESSETVVLDSAPLAEEFADESAKIDDAFAGLEDLDSAADDVELPPTDDEEFAALLHAEAPDTATKVEPSSELGEMDIDFGEPPEEVGTPAASGGAEPKSMFETASFPLVDDEASQKTAASSDDPVAEAEFQLAYGLYDEAEQTLKAVLEAEPGRLDAMEKLAEVYFAAGRESDFEALAKELKRDQAMTQEFRNVEALAHQLIPNSSLFDADQAPAVAPSDEVTATPDEIEIEPLEFDVAEEEVAEEAPAAASEIEMVAFDMPEEEPVSDDTRSVPETQIDKPAVADDPARTVEFVMPDLTADEPASEAVAELEAEPEAASELEPLVIGDAAAADQAPSGDSDELLDIALDETAALDDSELNLDSLSLDDGDLAESDLGDQTFEFDAAGLELEGLDEQSAELSLDDLSLDEEPTGTADAGEQEIAFTLDDSDSGTSDDTERTLQQGEPELAVEDEGINLEAFESDADDDLLSLDAAAADDAESVSDDGAFTLAEMEAASDDDLGLVMPEEPAAGEESDLDAFDDGINDDSDMNSKLDLARGYVDMGEIDMARSLLDEVVTRGNADQQAEARTMLESLA